VGALSKGDIVVLPFPFSDLSQTKPRPALVLAVPKPDEIIVCQITSQDSRSEYAIPITDSDFATGTLEKDLCFVRPNFVFLVDPKIVTRLIGTLKPEKLKEVIEATVDIIRNK